MSDGEPAAELLLKRQSALHICALGTLFILMLLAVQHIWPEVPRPEFFRYLPVIPALVFAFGTLIYPQAQMTAAEQSIFFRIKIAVCAAALLSPFSVWLMFFPEKHYFQVCSAMGWVALAYAVFEWPGFLALTARAGSFWRRSAHFVRYGAFIFLVLPAGGFFIRTLSRVDYLPKPLEELPFWGQILVLHPLVLLMILLAAFPAPAAHLSDGRKDSK